MTLKIYKNQWSSYSVMIYVFCIMISNSTGSIITKVGRLQLVALIAINLIQKFAISKKIFPIIGWNMAFLSYVVIGCYFAFFRSYAVSYTITLMYVIICNILVCIQISKDKDLIDQLLNVIVIGAIVKSLILYIQSGFLVFLLSRLTNDGTNANTFGFYCAIAGVICIYEVFFEKKKIYAFLGILNIILMLLSASRKSFIYLGIPLIIMFILKSNNPLKVVKNIVVSLVGVILVYLLLMNIGFLYNLVGNRIETMLNGFLGIGVVDASTSTRLKLIADGLEWFKERPWFGYGLSNYRALRASFYQGASASYYSHNNYIELLVNCGLIGTILFYSLHAKMLYTYVKKLNYLTNKSIMLVGILVALLVCDYGMVSYYDTLYHILLVLIFMNYKYNVNEE